LPLADVAVGRRRVHAISVNASGRGIEGRGIELAHLTANGAVD
jgi:hypothetical protein